MAAKPKPKPRRMRGYDIGGQIDMASGQYSGPTLSTDSLGRSISSGFAAGSQLGKSVNAAGKDDKKKPGDPGDPPGTLDGQGLYARGGRIKHTAGPKIGRDDGLIPAQRGEYVIRKSAVKKLGTKALGQVNRGKLPAAKRGR